MVGIYLSVYNNILKLKKVKQMKTGERRRRR